MRLKLDENLGRRYVEEFEAAGHEVATVAGQGMAGAADSEVAARCAAENRALVTLDLDFANPLLFDPLHYAGIAVLRLPNKAEPRDLRDAVRTLITALETRRLARKLWIVERARIREYQHPDDDDL